MTFSPLTSYTVEHHGKYNPRYDQGIVRIIVHHWAGTTGGDSRLTNPDQEVSANYILYSDGTLVGQVPEEYRAWTSGSWDYDAPSITVETQNSGVGGDWPVSDAAINTLTNLIADLANRYGWGNIAFGEQVRGHREFYPTACPGPYLWERLPQIAANANSIYQGGGAPAAPSGGTVSGDVDALAQAVIRGDYGNGPTRRATLGTRYDEVQARVNEILSGSAPAPAPVVSSDPATVQPGEGFWHVAKRVWGGDDATVEANMNKLIDINGAIRLYAGMVLQTEYPAAPVVDNSVAEAEAAAKAAAEAEAAAKAQAEKEAAEAASKAAEEAAKAEAEAKRLLEEEAAKAAVLEEAKKEEVKAEQVNNTVDDIVETVNDTLNNITEGINNIMNEKYEGKTLTAEQYQKLQNDIAALNNADLDEVKNYNLFSKEFWNYAGERVIKTFAMATAGQLSVTSAYVVTNPDSAVVFADLGWVYILSVAGVSALTSLLTALSNFKDITTIKKANNL